MEPRNWEHSRRSLTSPWSSVQGPSPSFQDALLIFLSLLSLSLSLSLPLSSLSLSLSLSSLSHTQHTYSYLLLSSASLPRLKEADNRFPSACIAFLLLYYLSLFTYILLSSAVLRDRAREHEGQRSSRFRTMPFPSCCPCAPGNHVDFPPPPSATTSFHGTSTRILRLAM